MEASRAKVICPKPHMRSEPRQAGTGDGGVVGAVRATLCQTAWAGDKKPAWPPLTRKQRHISTNGKPPREDPYGRDFFPHSHGHG